MMRLSQTLFGIAIVCVSIAGIVRADPNAQCHATIYFAYDWANDVYVLAVECTEDCSNPCTLTGNGVTGGQFVTCYCNHPANGACNAAVRSQSASNPSGTTVCLYGCPYPQDCQDQNGGDGTNYPWQAENSGDPDIWAFGFTCFCN